MLSGDTVSARSAPILWSSNVCTISACGGGNAGTRGIEGEGGEWGLLGSKARVGGCAIHRLDEAVAELTAEMAYSLPQCELALRHQKSCRVLVATA